MIVMDEFIKLLNADLEYIDHSMGEDTFFIKVKSNKFTAICPFCGCESSRVHSVYERSFQDLPIQAKNVVIVLQARKMFCGNQECNHTTFAERYSFLEKNSKKTKRLKDQIINIALETSSTSASDALGRSAIKASKSTICLMLKKIVASVDKRSDYKGLR